MHLERLFMKPTLVMTYLYSILVLQMIINNCITERVDGIFDR